MDRLIEIEYEPSGTGGACTVVDSHGIHIVFGCFTRFELEDLGIEIKGAEKLEKLLAYNVERVKKFVIPCAISTNEEWKDERTRRNQVPKKIVEPLRRIGMRIVMEHFSKNPKVFMKWLEKVKKGSFDLGKEAKIDEVKAVLNLD